MTSYFLHTCTLQAESSVEQNKQLKVAQKRLSQEEAQEQIT